MKTMIGQEGKRFPLGATLVPGGANFSVYAKHRMDEAHQETSLASPIAAIMSNDRNRAAQSKTPDTTRA
jgi:hypothetical protein